MDKYKHERASLVAVLMGAMLAAGCGGSSDASYEDLRREADSLRSQSMAQVESSPCSSDNECTGLVFRFPYFTCEQHDQHTYSKHSPGASAAEALAERQRRAAVEAIGKAPMPDFLCPAIALPAPRHVCVSNRCEQRPGAW
jgi:hypothetical protein